MKPDKNNNKKNEFIQNDGKNHKKEFSKNDDKGLDKDDLSYKVKFIPLNNSQKEFQGSKKSSNSGPERENRNNHSFPKKSSYQRDPYAKKSYNKETKNNETKAPYKKESDKSFKNIALINEGNDKPKKQYKPSYDPEVKNNNKPFKEFKPARQRISEKIKTPLEPGEIRLNKYIAQSGICSRREADDLIKKGLVMVNQNIITEMGFKVKPNDMVKYQGKIILSEPFVYIIMNKPKDFITTTEDDKGRKTVMDLLVDKVNERVFPIGRLDRNTTGVLIITNDGELSQMLTHPSFEIKKVYHVVLDKKVAQKDLDQLVEGIELEDGIVHADAVAYVESDDKRHVGIEIHSGKNRIVRRMFEHLGYDVEKLDRVSFGAFTKKDLPRGKWRHLNNYELATILKIKEGKK
ncbi:MAG: pseudouridine synthase [Bacteroidota bacterium]|nr:pseudouridine synthase [Bacteroidota bacterium]